MQHLWTGNAYDARNAEALFATGIDAVVDIAAEEAPATLPRDFIYCRFPILDGAANDKRVLQISCGTVASLVNADIKTIVCCGAGMSRSLTIAVVGLAVARREHPDGLLKELVRGISHDISPALWQHAVAASAASLPNQRHFE